MFLIHCLDKPGASSLRHEKRPLHLTYLRETLSILKAAGPLSNPAGESVGGTFILDVETHEQALKWAQDDPFALLGVYERVEVHAWKCLLGSGVPSGSANP